MKLKSAFNISLLSSILLFEFSYCAQPKEIHNGDIPVKEIAEQSNDLEMKDNPTLFETDSMTSFRIYLNLSDTKLQNIGRELDQMNSWITTENSDMTLALGGELFQLNKKRLELKTIIRKSLDNADTSFEALEATLTEDLEILEASVSDFKERNRKIK